MKIDIETLERHLDEREQTLRARELAHQEAGQALARDRQAIEFDRQALERAREMAGALLIELDFREPDRSTEKLPSTVKGWVVGACFEVAKFKPVFSSADIVEFLKSLPESSAPKFDIEKNRANISSYLIHDLVQDGVLKLVSPHSGRRPATFALKPRDQNVPS